MLSAKHDSDYDNVVLGRLTLWINLFICPLHSHYITVFLFSLRLIVTLSLIFHNLKLSTYILFSLGCIIFIWNVSFHQMDKTGSRNIFLLFICQILYRFPPDQSSHNYISTLPKTTVSGIIEEAEVYFTRQAPKSLKTLNHNIFDSFYIFIFQFISENK